ncbi:MAG: biopolymer transporter ExbD [Elusimicrobia bacterium]|nr:biopolymer transporter ExbD [Elusimicrobiota bacterium]
MDEDAPITDINVTPLVDVSLVLVIIFMAVAPFVLQAGIKVLHSKGSKVSTGKAAIAENVLIKMTAKGQILVNNQKTGIEELPRVVNHALNKSRDKMVIIQAEEKNRVGEVVEVMDLSKQAGAKKLALMKE